MAPRVCVRRSPLSTSLCRGWEDAGLVEGEYYKIEVGGQIAQERRYKIKGGGDEGLQRRSRVLCRCTGPGAEGMVGT